MGNGESTAKRISMQKTDEGSIQISEEVMKRLKKDNGQDAEIKMPEDDQIMIKEENLKRLVKDAFEKGKNVGEKLAIEKFQVENEKEESSRSKESDGIKNLKIKELEDLQKQFEDIQIHMQSQLEEKEKRIQDINVQVKAEKEQKEEFQKKLDQKEESLKIEFKRGVEDIQKIIRPLQTKTIYCEGLQNEVIECYKEHRYQPLRCSKIVDEYRKCVSEAKLKQMESNESL